MELRVEINRTYSNDKVTNGYCFVIDENNIVRFASPSLERGWLDNQVNVSCIPVGDYTMVLEYSPRFDTKLWEIYGVDGRSECKFHASNYWYQLNGCIALGNQVLDIDNDRQMDVLRSQETMRVFHDVLRPMNGKIVKLIVR